MPGTSSKARATGDERFAEDSLSSYGGIVAGFASTFANALDVSRSRVLKAVRSAEIDPVTHVDGNIGTTNPGGSTADVGSGTDVVAISLTKDDFITLKEALL
jgi:phage gp45-like